MSIIAKLKNKLSIDYGVATYWYSNTYDMLGSEWLYDALKNKLKLKKDFTFLSPSANIGRYERDTYDALVKDGYDPIFYVGDICGGQFECKVEASHRFQWIAGEGTDASRIRMASEGEGTVPTPFDVILDCKGALWHTLQGEEETLEKAIELLGNYYNLLKTDDSILLIDYYMHTYTRRLGNIYISLYHSIKKIRHKKVNMHYMAEYTTGFYLKNFMGDSITSKAFKCLDLEWKNKNFKDKLDFAICTKEGLKNYIEALKTIDNKTYKKALKRYKRSLTFYAFCAITPILLLYIYLIVH